jgi:hypothetical protein
MHFGSRQYEGLTGAGDYYMKKATLKSDDIRRSGDIFVYGIMKIPAPYEARDSFCGFHWSA